MRRFLHQHRWFTFMVAGLLVFATSGLMLSRMTCLIGGHSIYGIGLLEDCCPEDEHGHGATISPECCDTGAATPVQLELLAHASIDLEAVLMDLERSPMMVIPLPREKSFHWLQSRPPPQILDDRQAVHSIFLI